MIPTALAVAMGTAFAITALRTQGDSARLTQTALANVRADLNEESSLDWEARSGGSLSAKIRVRRQKLRARLSGELDTLARNDGDNWNPDGSSRQLLATYESAIDDMFRLIASNDLESAERVDSRRVDPLHDQLLERLASDDQQHGEDAAAILNRTRLGTFLSLGGATLALLLLFWRFRHIERRREREQKRSLQYEATHDHLTGLPNRRQLMADLDGPGGRRLFVFFDLDGFKSYNDTFGHVEGDLLLRRLGRKLASTIGTDGVAYRLGGDEFCLVAPYATDEADALVERATEALCERGEGFQVRASKGRVLIPDEAATGAAALVIADHRMYADKGAGRTSARQQTRDIVLRMQAERHPKLREHSSGVAKLARATGTSLGLSDTELDELERAAELHDIGKIAIPDAILDKQSPLDEDEWRFLGRHTLVGESMLSVAPALVSAARLVRSSHERLDGKGYPDGLIGDAIPLASRIVFVCDAFHAMTTQRPYGMTLTDDDALRELHRCEGTQFDPRVVSAFQAALKARSPVPLAA
jgi:diguanylate cyclase (GGDEF)-like protein